MVEKVVEDARRNIQGVEIVETPYVEKGYHFTLEVTKGTLLKAVQFFDERAFFLEDLCCVDHVEYLELVYFFNNYQYLCRAKVTLKVAPSEPVAPTISHVYDSAYFYEREIHEFFGVMFENHPNMTYLFLHEGIEAYPLRKGNVPVPEADKKLLASFKPKEEEDSFFVNMGPQHPSTHGVLRIVLKMDGEYIQSAQPVLGYLHRMHEKMAENRGYLQFLPNTGRMDYMSAMSFNLGYVTAVEKLCGIPVPPRAEFVRTITTELSRISSHFLWLGAYLADLGGLTPFLYVFDDREHILDALESVTGSRLTFCYFRFGGLYNDIDETFIGLTKAFVKRMWSRFKTYENLITGNVIFVNRTKGLGILEEATARKYGVSGPVIRGTGIAFDLRKREPFAAYRDMDFRIPTGTRGDVLDRYMVRMQEMETSLRIIEQALAKMPDGPFRTEKVPKKLKPPKGDLYHATESPRGLLGIYIVSDGSNTPYRMRWRVPSFSNLMSFPYLSRGTLIADAVSILGSLDLVIPEMDR